MNKRYEFNKLTPVNNVKLSIYEDALDFIFENNDIKNVGISGAYSAGKSSVIETYKKLRPDIKFMHISLAHFQSATESNLQNKEQDENVLEGKILNQLIHQIDSTKIPQTSFRVKREISQKTLLSSSLIFSIFVVLIVYLCNFDKWGDFVSSFSSDFIKNILSFTTVPLTAMITGGICIGILIYLTYSIIKTQLNKNLFKSISIQGNTIEIFEKSNESYFDKYLNEVLYLFENSDTDVIVFEDMDRFNTNQIFQRLREINTLVNNRSKDTNKPLRFFYLLKDDIFINKDRTKFFDFILPIVPVMDGSNSYDQFIAHFGSLNLLNIFDSHFLQEVSLYIDDMRILKNICNEFLVYHTRVSTTGQDPNKLLAMVIYKNIFPRDFSELQLNSGYIYTLFDQKGTFIIDEISNLQNQRDQILNIIKNAEHEHLKNEQEINEIYNPKIQQLQGYYNRQQEREQLIKEKATRLENVKNKSEERKNDFNQEVSDLESSINNLQHKKLHEIINKQNEDRIFMVVHINDIEEKSEFKDIKGSEYFALIKYLIRNGYIDETYTDYMSYFYENSLSINDKIFLRSVTDEEAKAYTYVLKNPELIVERLSSISYSKEEALNLDLLDYLLNHLTKQNKNNAHKLLSQIKADKNFEFISLYLSSPKNISAFVRELNTVWPEVFAAILSESHFTESQKKQYVMESIYGTPNEYLKEMDSDGSLSDYISSQKDFLNIDNPNINRISEVFSILNIKFKDINFISSDRKLFNMVYKNNFYTINYTTICLMLREVYGCSDETALIHSNYTTILSKNDEPMVNYIEQNINSYLEEVLNNCDGTIIDTEKAAIKILNNENIDKELKAEYIDMLDINIGSLRDINNAQLWSPLITNNILSYSEDNVVYYLFNNKDEFDNILAQFINEQGNSFDFNYDTIDGEFENGGFVFFNTIVKSKSLNIEPYKKILGSLHRIYQTFNIAEIDDEKIDVLIELNIIPMKLSSLAFMRENYKHKVIQYIEHNIDKYIENVIDEDSLAFEEILALLSTNIDDKYKLTLLEYTDEAISAINDKYSDEIKIYILKNNFDHDDIPKLLKTYSTLSEKVRSVLEKIVLTHIDDVIDNEYSVPYELCKKMFTLNLLDSSDKIQLFAVSVSNFDQEECKECLSILNLTELLSVFDGKRPTVPITNTNKKILDIFEQKHWIAGYHEDKQNPDMYRISSRRKPKPLPIEML